MNRFQRFRNEKGLTLVEILATLVILGIVFIGIMTLFPQMTLFNERTEVKLDTMNVAREELALFKQADIGNEFTKTAFHNWFSANRPEIQDLDIRQPSAGSYLLEYKIPQQYTVHIQILPSEDAEKFTDYQLHKVQLEIRESETARAMSKTYGYFKEVLAP